MKVKGAVAKGNEVTVELPDKVPYKMGESIDVDTKKVRITGKVNWILNNIFKMKVTHILHKEYEIT